MAGLPRDRPGCGTNRRRGRLRVEKLALEPGARLLDIACGHGRHSLELARRRFHVTGVDLSPRSLEVAREAAEKEGLEVDFVQLDMRELAFESEFDAAINLFSCSATSKATTRTAQSSSVSRGRCAPAAGS